MTSQHSSQQTKPATPLPSSGNTASSSPTAPRAEEKAEGPEAQASNQPPNPRLAALATKRATLEATLVDLISQRSALVADAKLPSGLEMPVHWSEEQRTAQALASANAVLKEHIVLLHKYNEIKDIGQGLMGLIADKRGVRIGAVMEDFGMGDKD